MINFIEINGKTISRDTYIDTVRVYFRRYPKSDEISEIRKRCGSLIQLPSMTYLYQWKTGLALNQPNKELFLFIDKTFSGKLIVRVDFALDLITEDVIDARKIQEYLDRYQIKPWHRKQRVGICKDTTYSSANPKVRNNLVRYATKVSKITGKPCCHVEWRIKSVTAINNAGICTLSDLIDFNHRGFWEKRIKLLQPMPEEIGRKFHGQPKRQKPWIRNYGNTPMNMFLRIGGALMRASCNRFDTSTAQEILDYMGREYRSCFAELPIDWMLPDN